MADSEATAGVFTLEEIGLGAQKGIPGAEGLDLGFAPTSQDALLVIDVQNGFTPGGALAVPGGTDVIPLANALVEKFETVVLSQDWHPEGHSSFASQYPGKSPLDTVELAYGSQTLWPDHCVQGTKGAAFHEDLAIPERCRVVRKGFRREIDSYSAFFENDRTTCTGLEAYLKGIGVTRVFVVGLAYDFCVRFTAEDARRCGFQAVVVKDGTRAVGAPGTVEAAAKGLEEAGVLVVQSCELAAALRGTM